MPSILKQKAALSHSLAVPSDATVLQNVQSVVCLTAGNLVAQGNEGVSLTYPMTAMQRLELSVSKIMAATTGTYSILR